MSRPTLKFRFTVRNKTSDEFTVRRSEFEIGRAEECRVRVPFPEVSRHHCRIKVEGGRILFQDLRPQGMGIWHNGHMERAGQIVKGDKFFIGYTCMELIAFEPEGRTTVAIPSSVDIGSSSGGGSSDTDPSKAASGFVSLDEPRRPVKSSMETAIMAALPKEIPSEMSMSMSTMDLFDALLKH